MECPAVVSVNVSSMVSEEEFLNVLRHLKVHLKIGKVGWIL